MNQPKGLLNQDIDISAAAVLYLVWLLTRAARHREFPTIFYNYYDGYQELTQELAGSGYAGVGEFMDDEVSMITPNGYLLVRNRYWFTEAQIATLDKLFPKVEFPEVIP